MKIRLIRLPFLIPTWAAAQVIFPRTIFYRGKPDRLRYDLIAHELGHVLQVERDGLLRYWWNYLTGLIRTGYNKHWMEKEADMFSNRGWVKSSASRLFHRAWTLTSWFTVVQVGAPTINSEGEYI